MSRISDEYLRWSMGQEKVSFRRDEAGKITKVIKRVDAALLPVYRALSKLQTPYLSPILSISEPDAGIIQVEESYIEGESLQEFLEAHGTLDEAEIQHCFLDIAQALKLLHSLQPPIIHRDIKPRILLRAKTGATSWWILTLPVSMRASRIQIPISYLRQDMPRRSSTGLGRATAEAIYLCWALPCSKCGPAGSFARAFRRQAGHWGGSLPAAPPCRQKTDTKAPGR